MISSNGKTVPVREGPGLVHWIGLLWGQCTSRKPGTCCYSGRPFGRGEQIYRPITNGIDRGKRVRFDAWEDVK